MASYFGSTTYNGLIPVSYDPSFFTISLETPFIVYFISYMRTAPVTSASRLVPKPCTTLSLRMVNDHELFTADNFK